MTSSDFTNAADFRADGEPLIKGSEIEVYRITALLAGGMSVGDILAAYPSLSSNAIEGAEAYARAHPNPGRPYPGMTTKHALEAAGLEKLDQVLDNSDP